MSDKEYEYNLQTRRQTFNVIFVDISIYSKVLKNKLSIMKYRQSQF